MTKAQVDTRSELAELVKRKHDIAGETAVLIRHQHEAHRPTMRLHTVKGNDMK